MLWTILTLWQETVNCLLSKHSENESARKTEAFMSCSHFILVYHFWFMGCWLKEEFSHHCDIPNRNAVGFPFNRKRWILLFSLWCYGLLLWCFLERDRSGHCCCTKELLQNTPFVFSGKTAYGLGMSRIECCCGKFCWSTCSSFVCQNC